MFSSPCLTGSEACSDNYPTGVSFPEVKTAGAGSLLLVFMYCWDQEGTGLFLGYVIRFQACSLIKHRDNFNFY
jgi:hypothetical protein